MRRRTLERLLLGRTLDRMIRERVAEKPAPARVKRGVQVYDAKDVEVRIGGVLVDGSVSVLAAS